MIAGLRQSHRDQFRCLRLVAGLRGTGDIEVGEFAFYNEVNGEDNAHRTRESLLAAAIAARGT
jgi:hypothetical protein